MSKNLSREEVIELFKRIEVGDEKAREDLLKAYRELVEEVASKYQNIKKQRTDQEVPLDYLLQEGNKGLMRAIERFDYRKGFRFTTYAIWWIRQAIMRALEDR